MWGRGGGERMEVEEEGEKKQILSLCQGPVSHATHLCSTLLLALATATKSRGRKILAASASSDYLYQRFTLIFKIATQSISHNIDL